ncbi:MAG: hypothetical protein ACK4NC_01145 [Candidatus Gracilibacteria bacterium]
MDIIDLVLAEIIARLELNLDDEKKAQYKEKIAPIVEQRVLSVILSSLSDEEMEALSNENMDDMDMFKALSLLSENTERDQKITEAMEELIVELTTLPK